MIYCLCELPPCTSSIWQQNEHALEVMIAFCLQGLVVLCSLLAISAVWQPLAFPFIW